MHEVNPEALRNLRVKDGLSVTALAAKAGIGRAHLSNIEAGRRGCSPAALKRLAEALAVPVSALLWRAAA